MSGHNRVEVKRSRLAGADVITPAAAPVDRFARTSEGSGLAQISRALGQVSPEVAKLGQSLFEVELKKDTDEGAEDAAKAQLLGYNTVKSAVDAGAMRADQTRAYRRSAQEIMGANMAARYGTAVNEFIASSLKDETDQEAADAKLAEFRSNWIEENVSQVENQHFQGAFARQAAAIETEKRANLAWNIGQNFKKQTEEAFAQLAVNAIYMEMDRVNFTEEGALQALSAVRVKGFEMGIKGPQVNELMFVAISERAIADGNVAVIDRLAMMPTGPNGSTRLVENPKFTLRLAEASRKALATRHAKRQLASEARADAARSVTKDLYDALAAAEDPSLVDLTEFRARMNEADPSQVDKIDTRRHAYVVGKTREENAVVGEMLDPLLYLRGDEALTEDELYLWLESERINSDQFEYYRKKIKERDKIMADPSYPRYRAAISRIKTVAVDDLVSRFGPVVGEVPRAFMANIKATLRTLLEEFAWEWKAANPAATDAEVQAALSEQAELMITEQLAILRGAGMGSDEDSDEE